MPRTIFFFVAEDELSNKVSAILNDLIGKIKGSAKIRYSESVGVSMTNVRIGLKSALGKEDALELRIHAMLEAYAESLKIRYGLPGIPAVKLGEAVRWGEDAVSAASILHSLLVEGGTLTAEQVFYEIANYIQGSAGAVSMPEKEAPMVGATASRDKIQGIVDFLLKGNPDIMGCAILNDKGMIIACSMPSEIGEERISAVFTALQDIIENGVQQMALERINQLMIFAEKGGALLHRHNNLFLLVLIKPEAKLGAILMDLKNAIDELDQITATKP
ncbi:MAG: hypothetical protein QXJ99_01555 [Thermofilum sp.]